MLCCLLLSPGDDLSRMHLVEDFLPFVFQPVQHGASYRGTSSDCMSPLQQPDV
ncbi:MAG TPA: hypothetical protein VES66_08065 [Terriglobales bacterium]|nr:hypothetical protein [Terriglobales bacterium]